MITENELFTTVLYFFGKARAFACTYLFDHKNIQMVYCLETDPNELIKLSYYDLKENEKARKI